MFNVGDPTPVIASISPATWSAGMNTQIVIGGRGFGTNPALTISGPGVAGSAMTSASDTQIVAMVTVAASSPGGTATVQVQSNGYGGNGFVAANPGQSPQSSNTANIQPLPAPVPQILFHSSNVTGTTQNVVVGQQIALTVSTSNLPLGLSIQSQSWSGISATAAVGGYIASANSGQVVELPAMSGPGATFYWITLMVHSRRLPAIAHRFLSH